ncbi:MAG TPA: RimK family protein [Candidatus Enterocola sp.]|nr:RimK family protein [Candidatus Enterocola sp.]
MYNNVLILLDNLDDWKPYYDTNSVMSVSNYLQAQLIGKERKLIINLSNDYTYNSEGYYCSLLAQTRGHQVLPDIETINRLKIGSFIRMPASLQKVCYQWIQSQNIQTETWTLNIYFGKCAEAGLERIARFIFENFPCPILNVTFNNHSKNQIESIQALGINMLNESEQDCFAAALDTFNKKIWRIPRSSKPARYNLAILYDPEEKFPPSNKQAINKFLEIAKKMDIRAELVTEEDITRLMEFDALFIRTTTSLNHYTFHWSQTARQNGLAVIDDPVSIIRCTNKVYLNELFYKEHIPAPKSTLLFKSNPKTFDEIAEILGAPFILKIPDGSFSIGMYKIENQKALDDALNVLYVHSSIILAQAFIPTEFDWRVSILNGEPIYVCKYYMAKNHWQIYHHYKSGKSRCGIVETLPIYKVPRKIIDTALKAANLIGKGLYGIDLKTVDDKVLVIEINDNPSIDHGCEDIVLGDELYYRILNYFEREVDKNR